MQKTTLWVKELRKLALNDPSVLFYLVEVYMAHDRLKDALTLLAKTLLDHPLMVQLLFKQAQCLFKYKYFEYALTVVKTCCDLCPQSFEAWFLYAQCQFELKNIKQGLIALDIAPEQKDILFLSIPYPEQQYDISVPLEKNNSDCFQYFMIPTTNTIDYINAQFSEAYSLRQYNLRPDKYRPEPYYGCVDQRDVEKANQLYDNLQEYLKWSNRDKRIYQLITELEQEITLESLVKIKKSTFVTIREEKK